MRICSLLKPEYLLQPGQALKRILQSIKLGLKQTFHFSESPQQRIQCLPWDMPLEFSSADEIGKSLLKTGIYDLSLTEVLWRVVQKGATCFDIGANIGYASSIMARRVGHSGQVIAFEPHPGNFAALIHNIHTWSEERSLSSVTAVPEGLSNDEGRKLLFIPPGFSENSGLPHFYEKNENSQETGEDIEVTVTTLDSYCRKNAIQKIDVLKIDVEGHEIPVLEGAIQLLSSQKIKFILFEDSRAHWRTPSELYTDYKILRDAQYEIFRVKRRLLGLEFDSLHEFRDDKSTYWRSWEPPNFIAFPVGTFKMKDLRKTGWYSLRKKEFLFDVIPHSDGKE